MIKAVKVLLVIVGVIAFAVAGGAVNLNLSAWRHGDHPALFVDFFFGMAVCLVVGLAIGGFLTLRLLKK